MRGFTIHHIDTDEAREIHKLAFGGEKWVGDDHEFWVVKDKHGAVAGFCSAVWITVSGIFLSRAAVAKKYAGKGLQRFMIEHRLEWARKQRAVIAVTYVEIYNYPSIVNLLRCGFRFGNPHQLRDGRGRPNKDHLLYKPLPFDKTKLADTVIQYAFDKMAEATE